jgi:hypothetical protein
VATYLQWSKSRQVRQVTWVCGPEPVLARDVVAAHREGAPPDQWAAVFAGDTPEPVIWDLVLSVPPAGGRRTVVYSAEKLRAPGSIALLAGEPALDTSYVVFVSGETDFARPDGALAPHLAVLQKSKAGQLVRCCEPSKLEDRVALVAGWWPGASPNFAYDVLTRCGSLERAWLACEQARLAQLDPGPATAAAVCPGVVSGDFADLLMAGNRKGAAQAADLLARNDLGAAIGLLASRLAVAEQIAGGVRQGMKPREAASREHIDQFVAGRVIPHLAAYGADRIRRCRALLAGAEASWRSGARTGVAESLVALW